MNPNSPLAPSPLLKDEPASGLDCSGDFKAAPDIRQSGPAAGGGYVLRAGPKVKVGGDRLFERAAIGWTKIKGLAGRSGRARTCDPRCSTSHTPTNDFRYQRRRYGLASAATSVGPITPRRH